MWKICSKLTTETTNVILVTSLLNFNIVDMFLVGFFLVWTYKCRMENFIALIWIYIMCFGVWSRSPEAKLSLPRVNNSFQLFPIFVKRKSSILDVRWSTKNLNGIRGKGRPPHKVKCNLGKIWKTHHSRCPKDTFPEVFHIKFLHLISNGLNRVNINSLT